VKELSNNLPRQHKQAQTNSISKQQQQKGADVIDISLTDQKQLQ
jgi:hypothetical protein